MARRKSAGRIMYESGTRLQEKVKEQAETIKALSDVLAGWSGRGHDLGPSGATCRACLVFAPHHYPGCNVAAALTKAGVLP